MTTSGEGGRELLDRDRTLRTIEALIAEATARGEPSMIRIAGRAGIGKTALLRHVAARHDGPARWAAAEPADRARPGAIVRRLLGSDFRVRGDDANLASALRANVAPNTLLCVDDLQWIDELSRRALRTLIATATAAPFVIVAGDRRDDAPELGLHRTVALVPLRAAAADRLVRRIFPNAAQDVIDEIVAASDGLPFSIEFLAQEAARDEAGARDEAAPSVPAAIAARLDRCSPSARATARQCALVGGPVDLRLIARSLARSVDAVSGDVAELADLMEVDDLRVSFRHDSIGDAVRGAIADPLPSYRALLAAHDPHSDAPEGLVTKLHCARACGDDAAAADAALRLGRASAAARSLATAVEYLQIAMRYAPRPLPVIYALEYAGVLQHLGRDEQAGEVLRAELRAAIERRDTDSATELLTSYGSVALTLERFAEFDAFADQVAVLAQREAPAEHDTVAAARLAALAYSGRLADFERVARAVRVRPMDQRFVAYAAALRGDADAAQQALGTYGATLRARHARQTTPDDALGAAITFFRSGNGALVELERHWGEVRPRDAYLTFAAMQIVSRLNDGRWTDADAIIQDLPLRDEEYDEPYAVLDARLMFTAVARRPIAAADRTLRDIRLMIARRRRRHAVAAAAWYWLARAQHGDDVPPDITSFVADALDVAPMPYLYGGIPLYIACLAEYVGRDRATHALDATAGLGSRWHRAHDALARGLLSGDNDHLRRARDAFDALGAPVFAALAGLALPVPRASDVAFAQKVGIGVGIREPSEPAHKLTRRERDVAELAAQGLANKEIALRLTISERTVEVHLTSAFRKLAVRSRSGLAPALSRQRFVEP